MSATHAQPFSLVVLISGEGSNLQAIIDAIQQGKLPVQIAAVISNRPDAAGLERAKRAGINTEVIEARSYVDRAAYDRALAKCIDHYAPQLIVLAGFMRILTDDFVRHYTGRLINIHPSLLPKYKGLNTHQRVLDAGDTEHGATVHYVTPELDSGPIILQARVPVLATDTADTLQQRVHQAEHRLYPEAICRIASGRVQLKGEIVYLDEQPITQLQQNFAI